jgi:hypothetical protein
MMRAAFVSLGLWAGAHGAAAQNGWLIDQDSIQLGMFSGSGRSVRETTDGYILFSNAVNPTAPFRGGIQLKSLNTSGHQLGVQYLTLDTISRNVGYIDPITDCSNSGYAFPLLDFLGNGSMYCRGHLFRTDTNGDTLWSRVLFTHPSSDSILVLMRTITESAASGFYIAGAIDYPSVTGFGYLIRTNALGDTLWTRTYPSVNAFLDIAPYIDSGFSLSGYRLGSQPDGNVTIRTDSLGNVLWTRFSGAQGGFNSAHVVTADSCIATLTEYRPNSQFDDGYMELTKRGANGNTIWQKRSHFGDTYTYDLEVLSDGSYICTGAWEGLAVVQKFTPQGDSLWSRYYEWFNSTHQLYDIEPTSDGGFVATGRAWQGGSDPHPGLETIIVLKTDSLGCVVPGCQFVGLEENAMGLQNTLVVYPNPSTGLFTLALTLPATVALAGDLTLQVFDAQGRLVERRNLGRQLEQRIALDLTAQPTGLYSAHLSDGKRILTGVRLVVSPP